MIVSKPENKLKENLKKYSFLVFIPITFSFMMFAIISLLSIIGLGTMQLQNPHALDNNGWLNYNFLWFLVRAFPFVIMLGYIFFIVWYGFFFGRKKQTFPLGYKKPKKDFIQLLRKKTKESK